MHRGRQTAEAESGHSSSHVGRNGMLPGSCHHANCRPGRPAPCGRRNGQAILEYVMVAAMLLLIVVMLAVLLYTFREHGARVLELAASEYP